MGGSGAGTTAEEALTQLASRAEASWTPAPLGSAFGFVATPWIDGVPLTAADADAGVLAHVGRYMVEVAGPPLPGQEQSDALARLREMLYWNTWEALGEEAAARAEHWGETAEALGPALPLLSYGDGRLAPHEWLRTAAGRLLKVDSGGHDADHTIVGRQPLVWDVAGAVVEWQLDAPGTAVLLAAVRKAGGLEIPPWALTFYRMAYAALRLGQCTLCAAMSVHDPDEQARLWRACTRYQEELAGLLSSELPG